MQTWPGARVLCPPSKDSLGRREGRWHAGDDRHASRPAERPALSLQATALLPWGHVPGSERTQEPCRRPSVLTAVHSHGCLRCIGLCGQVLSGVAVGARASARAETGGADIPRGSHDSQPGGRGIPEHRPLAAPRLSSQKEGPRGWGEWRVGSCSSLSPPMQCAVGPWFQAPLTLPIPRPSDAFQVQLNHCGAPVESVTSAAGSWVVESVSWLPVDWC